MHSAAYTIGIATQILQVDLKSKNRDNRYDKNSFLLEFEF